MEPKTVEEIGAILLGCKDRAALYAVLGDVFGMSVSQRRALMKAWRGSADDPPEPEPEPLPPAAIEPKELTRADVARVFRTAREKSAAREQAIRAAVLPAAQAEARQTHGAYCPAYGTFSTAGGSLRTFEIPERYDAGILDAIVTRMADTVTAALEGNKTADAIEAALVCLDWSDQAIAEYLEAFGPPS